MAQARAAEEKGARKRVEKKRTDAAAKKTAETAKAAKAAQAGKKKREGRGDAAGYVSCRGLGRPDGSQ